MNEDIRRQIQEQIERKLAESQEKWQRKVKQIQIESQQKWQRRSQQLQKKWRDHLLMKKFVVSGAFVVTYCAGFLTGASYHKLFNKTPK